MSNSACMSLIMLLHQQGWCVSQTRHYMSFSIKMPSDYNSPLQSHSAILNWVTRKRGWRWSTTSRAEMNSWQSGAWDARNTMSAVFRVDRLHTWITCVVNGIIQKKFCDYPFFNKSWLCVKYQCLYLQAAHWQLILFYERRGSDCLLGKIHIWDSFLSDAYAVGYLLGFLTYLSYFLQMLFLRSLRISSLKTHSWTWWVTRRVMCTRWCYMM